MFDSIKSDLKELLSKIDRGLIQLPDFQRSYVWADDDVRSLIASIAKGFPVGALLTLETGGEVNFRPRPLEGVEGSRGNPSELLLDGQQRMTSLYQALYSRKPVLTLNYKGDRVERYYYMDIKLAIESDAHVEDAIIGVPKGKVLRSDFGRKIEVDVSTRKLEFAQGLFPLNEVFDNRNWFFEWHDYCRILGKRDAADLERDFVEGTLELIDRYEMPIIRLEKGNSREAICVVFEKVNVGGKKLDAFELLTALYAADDFNLREDWNGMVDPRRPGRRQRMVGESNRKRDILTGIASTDFLQACTLLYTRSLHVTKAAEGVARRELPQITCRRDALLGLPLSAYQEHCDAVEQGFIEASKFLNELKIIRSKDVPYPPQVVTLASMFAIIGSRQLSAIDKQKLSQWFWSVTMGELYGSSTESRIAKDAHELVEWITQGNQKPRSMDEALFQQDRLRSLLSRNSAAYKGIHALLMVRGCQDFITGRPTEMMTFFDDQIDIHHIFPQDWCKKQGISPKKFNSVVNKTPLSRRSNILIGGKAPSAYLRQIEGNHGFTSDQLDDVLRTHLIEPALLRADDFEGFFAARINALSALVGESMGKSVVQGLGQNEDETEAPESAAGDEEVEEAV